MMPAIANSTRLATWPTELDLPRLKGLYGSPAWIVSEAQLIKNLNAFVRFTGAPERVLFPVKTNPSLSVLRILAQQGAGADCAHQTEIDLALFAGIRPEHISFNSPVQDTDLCIRLLQSGSTVVMDDPEAIHSVAERMGHAPFSGKLVLRVNPAASIGYAHKKDNQDLMSHGHQSSKFGIPAEDVLPFVKTIGLPVSGLHVHVGTQMDNIDSFLEGMRALNTLADELRGCGHEIRDINLGGGLGISFTEQDSFPSIDTWTDALSQLKSPYYTYFAEPGHALVGNAVALLCEVMTIKPSRGKRWAITNVGTDQLAKVTLLHWPHRILQPDGRPLPAGNDAVAGPLCFAGDTLLDKVDVGALTPGSPLLVTEAGAYTYSLSNRFNGRLAPAWILLKKNGETGLSTEHEGRYDNPQLSGFRWEELRKDGAMVALEADRVADLSSQYLKVLANEDTFDYLYFGREGNNTYRIEVATRSRAGFLSMPLAIRVFGDATIVALLDYCGHNKKEIPVWGRKLNLDCFEQVSTSEPIRFLVSISEVTGTGAKTAITRFSTVCGKCSGSFVIKL